MMLNEKMLIEEEQQAKVCYMFPKFTPEDAAVASDYKLSIKKETDEDTIVCGYMKDILLFAEDYLGYECTDEYFCDMSELNEGIFDAIKNKAKEVVANAKERHARTKNAQTFDDLKNVKNQNKAMKLIKSIESDSKARSYIYYVKGSNGRVAKKTFDQYKALDPATKMNNVIITEKEVTDKFAPALVAQGMVDYRGKGKTVTKDQLKQMFGAGTQITYQDGNKIAADQNIAKSYKDFTYVVGDKKVNFDGLMQGIKLAQQKKAGGFTPTKLQTAYAVDKKGNRYEYASIKDVIAKELANQNNAVAASQETTDNKNAHAAGQQNNQKYDIKSMKFFKTGDNTPIDAKTFAKLPSDQKAQYKYFTSNLNTGKKLVTVLNSNAEASKALKLQARTNESLKEAFDRCTSIRPLVDDWDNLDDNVDGLI